MKWRLRYIGAKKTFKGSKYDHCNTADNSFPKKLISYSICEARCLPKRHKGIISQALLLWVSQNSVQNISSQFTLFIDLQIIIAILKSVSQFSSLSLLMTSYFLYFTWEQRLRQWCNRRIEVMQLIWVSDSQKSNCHFCYSVPSTYRTTRLIWPLTMCSNLALIAKVMSADLTYRRFLVAGVNGVCMSFTSPVIYRNGRCL